MKNMKKSMLVMAMAIALAMSTMSGAFAGVERYQFTDVVLDIKEVNGSTNNWHYYEFQHDPCTNAWTVVEAKFGEGSETVTDISVDGNEVTYTSSYDSRVYVYTATLDTTGGVLSLVDANPESGVRSVTGTGSITQTSYNHGEYVAESIDEYGNAAHSCIGMPKVSQKNR